MSFKKFQCANYKNKIHLTWGGVMWTFSFPPTNNRTVDENLVFVFITCGGCFSIMNVLQHINKHLTNLNTEWHVICLFTSTCMGKVLSHTSGTPFSVNELILSLLHNKTQSWVPGTYTTCLFNESTNGCFSL